MFDAEKLFKLIQKLTDYKIFVTLLNYILFIDCYLNIFYGLNLSNFYDNLKVLFTIKDIVQATLLVGFYTSYVIPKFTSFISFLKGLLPYSLLKNLYDFVDGDKTCYVDVEMLKRWAILNKNRLAYSLCENHEKKSEHYYAMKTLFLSILILLCVDHYLLQDTVINELLIFLKNKNIYLKIFIEMFLWLFILEILLIRFSMEIHINTFRDYIFFPEHEYSKDKIEKQRETEGSVFDKNFLINKRDSLYL